MIQPSISIGVVSYPDDGRTSDELMITADASMYRSKRAGKNRVTRRPGHGRGRRSASRRSTRSPQRPTRDRHAERARPRQSRAGRGSARERGRQVGVGSAGWPTTSPAPAADDVTPRGFATRAIRAAHRLPVVDQPPTSVPIYQTVTFSAADAEELGAVAEPPDPGLRLRPPRQPDGRRVRRGGRRARGRRGRVRVRLGDGRDPRRARDAPLGRRPGRRDPGLVRHDPGPADAASSAGSA